MTAPLLYHGAVKSVGRREMWIGLRFSVVSVWYWRSTNWPTTFSGKISNGHISATGHPNQFLVLYISITVQDGHMIIMDDLWKTPYVGKSNDHVTDDATWPQNSNTQYRSVTSTLADRHPAVAKAGHSSSKLCYTRNTRCERCWK